MKNLMKALALTGLAASAIGCQTMTQQRVMYDKEARGYVRVTEEVKHYPTSKDLVIGSVRYAASNIAFVGIPAISDLYFTLKGDYSSTTLMRCIYLQHTNDTKDKTSVKIISKEPVPIEEALKQ